MKSRILFVTISLISLCFLIQACSNLDNVTKDINNSLNKYLALPEESVDPKNFESMPFEMVVNRSFESQLQGKDIKFSARYKGTVPNPDKYKGVKDFTNLKMCDLDKKDVCSDLIVIKNTYVKSVLSLADNQSVDVYGSILEVSGVEAGNSGQIDFATYNMKAPYMWFRAYKVVPAGQKISSNNNEASQKVDNSKTIDVKTAQELLNQNGYDAGFADGKMGPKTREAIKNFQGDNGLSLTGRLDSNTMIKLQEYQ